MRSFSLQNTTRRNIPSFALFTRIAKDILPRFDISLVFVSRAKALTLNKHLRNKTYAPNVLSYLVGKDSGEVIICPDVVYAQASEFELSPHDFFILLFIHALLHLKGRSHGATMERSEQKLLAKYTRGTTTHHNRNRHRHVPSKNGSGRRARR
jgi:probable rRNA maturation factor